MQVWQYYISILIHCDVNVHDISELKQVTFLTTRTSTGSKVDVFHQSQPLTQSSDVTHAVRVVKNVTCLSSLLHFAHPSYPGYFIQPAATQREPLDILVLGSQARGTRLLHCVIPIFRGLKMRDVSTSRDQTGSFLSYQILPKSHEIGKKSSGMSGD